MPLFEAAIGITAISLVCVAAATYLFIRDKKKSSKKSIYDVVAPVLNPEPTPTIFKAGIRLGPMAYTSNDGQNWVTVTVISVDGETDVYNDNQTVTYVFDSPSAIGDELKPITEPVSVFLSKFMLTGIARNERHIF